MVMTQARRRLTGLVDRLPPLQRLVRSIAASDLRRSGFDAMADEVRTGSGSWTAARSLQVAQWARSVGDEAKRPPRSFNVGDHLRSEPARREAEAGVLRALERRSAGSSREPLQRALIGLDDRPTLDDLGAAIRNDVASLLLHKAESPRPRKGAIPSDLQHEIIVSLTRRLAEIGQSPFLMAGTLLGVVRNGDYLPYDYDIDLGLLPGSDDAATVRSLAADRDFEVEVDGPRIVVTHTSGARTDIFPHEFREDRFWHLTRVHEWWNTPFELAPIDVHGESLWAPDDTHRYLAESYGDWTRPIAFYDISFDTPNRRYRRTAEAMRFLHSRCVIGLRTGDRWLVESAVRELRDHFGIEVTDNLSPTSLLAAGQIAPGDSPASEPPID